MELLLSLVGMMTFALTAGSDQSEEVSLSSLGSVLSGVASTGCDHVSVRVFTGECTVKYGCLCFFPRWELRNWTH